MSRFEIKMPKLAESITEGVITSWSVKLGDIIKEDDILFEVETAKVSSEIPSPVAGKIIEILFEEGDTVPVGETVAIVDLTGEATVVTKTSPDETKKEEIATVAPSSSVETSVPKIEVEITKGDGKNWLSPVVQQLAKASKITDKELNEISGTGYLGRISKKDMVDYINSKAQNISLPPKSVQRQSEKDVKVEAISPSVARPTEDTVVEMDNIRRITAQRMIESRQTSAHVTTVVEADVTKLVKWRSKHKDKFMAREGIGLTYMPSIVESTAKALTEFPEINASVSGNQIIRKKDINIGIAVALDGWNLIVPVIRHADQLNISGLALEINNLAEKARANKLKLDEITGGTFTITNFGSFKNIMGTPIINQPEVAILGVGFIEKKPAVISTKEGDSIAIRHKMYLSLSYDHRVIDGALGGAFVRRIADILENWEE